jgi:hypothetical protein
MRTSLTFVVMLTAALTLSAVTIGLVGTATQLFQRLGTDLARSELLRDRGLYAGRIIANAL